MSFSGGGGGVALKQILHVNVTSYSTVLYILKIKKMVFNFKQPPKQLQG